MLFAEWTPTEVSTLVGIVSAALGGLLTFLSTKGVDAFLKVRADARKDRDAKRSEEVEADSRLEAVNSAMIADLKYQVKEILKELKDVQAQHLECEKNHSRLDGLMTAMNSELAHLRNIVIQPPAAVKP